MPASAAAIAAEKPTTGLGRHAERVGGRRLERRETARGFGNDVLDQR